MSAGLATSIAGGRNRLHHPEGRSMIGARQIGPVRRTDRIDFHLVYLASLPFCLAVALLARLRPGDHVESGLSILGQARAAARTCGSFALMG